MKYQFRIRNLLITFALIAVGFVIVAWVNRRLEPPSLPFETRLARVSDLRKTIEYRLSGPVFQLKLARWLKSATPSKAGGRGLTKYYDLAILDEAGEETTIQIFFSGAQETDDHPQLHFLWQGQLWSASRQEIVDLLTYDLSVKADGNAFENKVNWTGYYFDTNGNGKIDRKVVNLTAEERLVWLDTDGDGFFDDEHVSRLGTKDETTAAIIHVPVPAIK